VKAKHFFNQLEHDRITAAIQAAERGTSGDIVLFITHHAVRDALAAAHTVFTRRHLEKAADDNSLLLFLAPKSQTFAVVGGKALHDRVGQDWWDALIGTLTHHFKQGRFTVGLVAAIEKSGHALQRHFPAQDVDRTGQSDIVED
jgi:uncharacterized membrane protein